MEQRMAGDLGPTLLALGVVVVAIPTGFVPLAWVIRKRGNVWGLIGASLAATTALTLAMEYRLTGIRRTVDVVASPGVVSMEVMMWASFLLPAFAATGLFVDRTIRRQPGQSLRPPQLLKGIASFIAGILLASVAFLVYDATRLF
jgi:hypothetical protein